MATYSIKAPDGNTYDIDGPEGASDEQVRARVLVAHPEAGKTRAPAAPDAFDAAIKASSGLPADDNFFGNVRRGMGKAFADVGLGAQQLAASVGIGDKEALNAEAAEREKRDAALMGTGGGMVGKYGTDVAASFLPFGAATRAASAAKFLPSAVRAVAPSAAIGAGQAALTPDADYSLGKELATGAAGGVVGDVIGRGLGRVLKPMREAASEHLGELTRMPALLAENRTDNKFIKTMTDALSNLGPAGAGVNKARSANLGQFTEDVTRAAGTPTTELMPDKARAMADALTAQIEQFKQGPPVSLRDLPWALAPTLREVRGVTDIVGGSTKPISQAMRAAWGREIPASDALAIRSKASDAAYGTQDWAKKEQYRALRDAMDDAISATHPDSGQAFQKWKAEYGTMKDIEKAGISPSGHVLPKDLVNQLSSSAQLAPRTPLERETVAAAAQLSPAAAQNRYAASRLLTGSLPYVAAGSGLLLGGPVGLGVAAGTLGLGHSLFGTPAGGRYLTGQVNSDFAKALQSAKARELARLLAVTATNEIDQ